MPRRSLDQWYSCHSCHYNGGVNSKTMDTLNDGSDLTMKTVLPLHHLRHTSPWTWHGWQTDLHDAMHKSFTSTMQGQPINQEEMRALLAFLETLQRPPNPFRNPDGSLTAAAQRGKIIFTSKQAGCANLSFRTVFHRRQNPRCGSRIGRRLLPRLQYPLVTGRLSQGPFSPRRTRQIPGCRSKRRSRPSTGHW